MSRLCGNAKVNQVSWATGRSGSHEEDSTTFGGLAKAEVECCDLLHARVNEPGNQ